MRWASREGMTLLLSIYAGLVAAVGAALGDKVLISALPVLAVASMPGAGLLGRGLLLATLVFEASVAARYYIALLPALVLAPLVYAEPPRMPPRGWLGRLHLGPAGLRLLVHAGILLLASLIEPSIVLPAFTAIVAANVYAARGYARLRTTALRVIHAPRRLAWGSRGRILVRIEPSMPAWIVVVLNEGARRYMVREPSIVEVPLEAETLGDHVVKLDVYAYTLDGLAQRHLYGGLLRYRVIPQTVLAAEQAASRVLSRVEWAATGRLEAALYEGVGVGPGRRLVMRSPRITAGGGATTAGAGVGWLLEELYLRMAGKGVGLGLRRSRLGEYLGARLYVPGDDPRLIHWKKSVSRQELVVREYGAASAGVGGVPSAGMPEVFVVDLASSTPRELDALVRRFIHQLSKLALQNPIAAVVALLHYGGKYLVVKGAVVDVLRELTAQLAESLPALLYDYESLAADPTEAVIRGLERREPGGKIVNTIALHVVSYVSDVTEILQRSRIRSRAYCTILHTRATSLRNTTLERRLHSLGFETRNTTVGREASTTMEAGLQARLVSPLKG
jgi:hypothetical protein